MPSILVIDDDRSVLHLVKQAFKESDVDVVTAETADDGLEKIEQVRPDVALLDIMLRETSGLELFEEIRRIDSKLPIIFITAGGSSDTAIEAMKMGAYDYLLKPLDLGKVESLVKQALTIRRLMRVPVGIPKLDAAEENGDQMIGRSPQMQEVYKAVGRVAPQDVTVLIRGESGTGKELIARAIYQHSKRAGRPFLAVNCAAIPETLLESELFGHEKGSFTGADSRRIGKFEQCDGGTMFLDEVGDMSLLVQSKLLRLLQEQRFERVGGNQTIQTNVRIVAATNRDLEKMVAEQTFRSDLYYRLNGFTIKLPPVRERGSDILLLLQHFLAHYARELHKEVHTISPEALNLLTNYPWPGNVREMQTGIRQALLQATGPVIIPEFLPEAIRNGGRTRQEASGNGHASAGDLQEFVESRLKAGSQEVYAEALEWMDRYLLVRVLRMTDGNQSQAAEILGITRGSLRNKIRTLGISIGQVVDVGNDVADGQMSKAQ